MTKLTNDEISSLWIDAKAERKAASAAGINLRTAERGFRRCP